MLLSEVNQPEDLTFEHAHCGSEYHLDYDHSQRHLALPKTTISEPQTKVFSMETGLRPEEK